MTDNGSALRRRMRAIGRTPRRSCRRWIQTHCEKRDQTYRRQTDGQIQTCVSRTWVRLTSLGRIVMIAWGWRFMCQMFHTPPRPRARDPPFIAVTMTPRAARNDGALCRAINDRTNVPPTLTHSRRDRAIVDESTRNTKIFVDVPA